jgi:phage tail-like protein
VATGDRKDHVIMAYFRVEIEGLEAGGFRKCNGLKTETEVYDYQEGGDNEGVRRLVGQTRTSNLLLTKGWVNTAVLWEWREKVASSGTNKIERKSGSIVALSDDQQELARWNFQKAWPVRWEMSELDSQTGGQAMCETLEIAIEKIVKG